MLKGHSKLGFEIKFKITIFDIEITVFEITEVKFSSPKSEWEQEQDIFIHMKNNIDIF
jgi:hypothetical protein